MLNHSIKVLIKVKKGPKTHKTQKGRFSLCMILVHKENRPLLPCELVHNGFYFLFFFCR